MRRPVEVPSIDNNAADRGAVPADVLGGGMHHYRSTMIERPADQRRSGVVHDEGNTKLAPDGRYLPDRKDGELRIRQRFRVVGPCASVRRVPETLGIARIDEANFDSHRGQCVGEQVPRATIEVGRAHHIVAVPAEILDREHGGRLA